MNTKEMIDVVLTFCENLAELGCPQFEKDSDMWFRHLSDEQREEVMVKLQDITKRNESMIMEEKTQDNLPEEKQYTMTEISLDLTPDVIEGVKRYARQYVVNDDDALINYGVNKILKEVVDTDGECLSHERK